MNGPFSYLLYIYLSRYLSVFLTIWKRKRKSIKWLTNFATFSLSLSFLFFILDNVSIFLIELLFNIKGNSILFLLLHCSFLWQILPNIFSILLSLCCTFSILLCSSELNFLCSFRFSVWHYCLTISNWLIEKTFSSFFLSWTSNLNM